MRPVSPKVDELQLMIGALDHAVLGLDVPVGVPLVMHVLRLASCACTSSARGQGVSHCVVICCVPCCHLLLLSASHVPPPEPTNTHSPLLRVAPKLGVLTKHHRAASFTPLFPKTSTLHRQPPSHYGQIARTAWSSWQKKKAAMGSGRRPSCSLSRSSRSGPKGIMLGGIMLKGIMLEGIMLAKTKHGAVEFWTRVCLQVRASGCK